MKAAVVLEAGQAPVYADFAEPVAGAGEVRVAVAAAALSHLARGRAAGAHYSSGAQRGFVAGVDGVGRLDDGRRVYFVLPTPPSGSMAQWAVVNAAQCVPVPDEVDDVTAAALAIPGMSSWVALRERARFVAGETVLVNGATGTSGALAVQVAKHLGAKKVIATGRDATKLRALESLGALGADVTIPLGQDEAALDRAFMEQFHNGVDVVLDYLWGPSAERLLIAAARAGEDAVPIRFVHIGGLSAPAITLPGAVLRSSAIELMGSGIGSVPLARQVAAVGELLRAAATRGFVIATRTAPLADVAAVWASDTGFPRVVFVV